MVKDRSHSNIYSPFKDEYSQTTATATNQQPIEKTIIQNLSTNPITTPTQYSSESSGSFTESQISILRSLPFWINDPTEHRNLFNQTNEACCFNHYVGLPEKFGKRSPLFDFQVHEQFKGKLGLFHAFERKNAVYVLKATGIGFSELTIRYMCWKAHTGPKSQYKNSHMVIVTGPNVELATKQITRIRDMYRDRLGVEFSSEKTRLTLPPHNVIIQAYPSHNVASFRGLPKVSIIFVDEGDFFPPGQQIAVRDAAERYLGKSNAKIILGSTPYEIGGLMETIQKEDPSIYYKLFINYEIGLNKIFSKEDIERAKQSPSFQREYNLKYGYDIGNVFTETAIQRCFDVEYNPDAVVYESPKTIGIDPAFGSSKFGITVSQFTDGRIQILYAEHLDRPDPEHVETLTLDLIRHFSMFDQSGRQNAQILVDGANISFIKWLKMKLNEYPHYEELNKEDYKFMKVRPINFGTEHRKLLTNCQELVSKGYVLIKENRFQDLVNEMRVAQADGSGALIKKPPLTMDLLDSFRLSLWGYEVSG